MLLPQADDVCYVVSHQYTEERFRQAPAELTARADVSISHMAGKGVARSRTNALRMCPEGVDIALFADDDGRYKREYIDDLMALCRQHPETDIFCLKIETNEGEPQYNAEYFTSPRHIITTYQLSIATPELAVRPDRVKEKHIAFDSRFGAGGGFIQFADENVFVHDCLQAGLSVWFYPQYVVNIPYENTIKKMPRYDARRVRTLGGMDTRVRGLWGGIRKAFGLTIRYAPAIRSEKHSLLKYLVDRLSGVFYIARTKRPTDDIL